jgi:catechol 2,3-dioxygenase-like lactoylglutathione lyase family enzyme
MEIVMEKNQGNSVPRIHLALNTNHFQESLEFYEALLGVRPSKIKPGYAKFEPDTPALNLTLNETRKVTGNRINHLGIQVHTKAAVSQQRERLTALGFNTLVEEGTTCCYALQDKVWARDPDGNAWETFIVLEDSDLERVDLPEKKTACC